MSSDIPISLAAEPHRTGNIFPSHTPFLKPCFISSSVRDSPARYFSSSESSVSAIDSNNCSRRFPANSLSGPWSFSISDRSRSETVCLKADSLPTGNSNGTQFLPNASFIESNAFSKSAFSLSNLFINSMRGRFLSFNISHPFSVPISTPLTPHTTHTPESTALRDDMTEPAKSAYPGVSIRYEILPLCCI